MFVGDVALELLDLQLNYILKMKLCQLAFFKASVTNIQGSEAARNARQDPKHSFSLPANSWLWGKLSKQMKIQIFVDGGGS